MLRHLTLVSPSSRGELLWDDEQGLFQGTDADLIEQVADGVPWHPHFPLVSEPARRDATSLLVLLHMMGWDVPPELKPELDALMEGVEALPPDAIA